jgi:hypothetical protein
VWAVKSYAFDPMALSVKVRATTQVRGTTQVQSTTLEAHTTTQVRATTLEAHTTTQVLATTLEAHTLYESEHRSADLEPKLLYGRQG